MSDGQWIPSQGPGSTLVGGAGNDTLSASSGPDRLTGNGGGDSFLFVSLPYTAGHITDFTVGSDRLDFTYLMQNYGYSGSDPIADGRVILRSDGADGTRVFFDRDAANFGEWPTLMTTLDHVSPNGLSSSERLVGIFRSVVEPAARLLTIGAVNLLHGGAVGFQTVGDDCLRSAMALHRALDESEGGGFVAGLGDAGFEDLALVIPRPLQVAHRRQSLRRPRRDASPVSVGPQCD